MPRGDARAKLVIPTVLAVVLLSCGSGDTRAGAGGGGGAGNPYDGIICSDRGKQDCETESAHACVWTSGDCFAACSEHTAFAECHADGTCTWTGTLCTLPV